MNRLVVALALLAAMSRVADAHQSTVTHSDVVVDGAAVTYTILVDPRDLVELQGTDTAAYVIARIAVFDGDTPCPPDRGRAEPADDFVRVTWTATCPAPVTVLAIEYDLFFDLDPLHETVLRVHAGDATADTVLRDGASRFVWELAEPPPSGTVAFIYSGVDHIIEGYDHVAFVLTLLLVIMLARDLDGWRRKSLPQSLRATALIVTSFTVAHTITLIAASLGWVSVPSRIVESAIAATIAYTALENIVRPDVRWRFVLTFLFGLVHGLGFASVLAVLLPPDDIVVPLLAFNVGVELGQLIIVSLALPLLWLLCALVGADRYRRYVMPAFSAVSLAFGLTWLAERVLDVTILGI